MRYLLFICTGSKFTTIPEAAGGFHGHDINRAGNDTYNPAGDVVDAFKAHIDFVMGWQI